MGIAPGNKANGGPDQPEPCETKEHQVPFPQNSPQLLKRTPAGMPLRGIPNQRESDQPHTESNAADNGESAAPAPMRGQPGYKQIGHDDPDPARRSHHQPKGRTQFPLGKNPGGIAHAGSKDHAPAQAGKKAAEKTRSIFLGQGDAKRPHALKNQGGGNDRARPEAISQKAAGDLGNDVTHEKGAHISTGCGHGNAQLRRCRADQRRPGEAHQKTHGKIGNRETMEQPTIRVRRGGFRLPGIQYCLLHKPAVCGTAYKPFLNGGTGTAFLSLGLLSCPPDQGERFPGPPGPCLTGRGSEVLLSHFAILRNGLPGWGSRQRPARQRHSQKNGRRN